MQISIQLVCRKCHKPWIVVFQEKTRKQIINAACNWQHTEDCGCNDPATKAREIASRELQASGLSDMYRPANKKPAIETNYDQDGNASRTKFSWQKPQTLTERTLAECANIPVRQAHQDWAKLYSIFWMDYETAMRDFNIIGVKDADKIDWVRFKPSLEVLEYFRNEPEPRVFGNQILKKGLVSKKIKHPKVGY